jgi:hypothetical protein
MLNYHSLRCIRQGKKVTKRFTRARKYLQGLQLRKNRQLLLPSAWFLLERKPLEVYIREEECPT